MIGYHGTSSKLLTTELRSGSYVAVDRSIAETYALDKAKEIGGKPIVYEVDIPEGWSQVKSAWGGYLLAAELHTNHELGFDFWMLYSGAKVLRVDYL